MLHLSNARKNNANPSENAHRDVAMQEHENLGLLLKIPLLTCLARQILDLPTSSFTPRFSSRI